MALRTRVPNPMLGWDDRDVHLPRYTVTSPPGASKPVAPTVVVFDLDGTLAPSKSKIDPTMAVLLLRLLRQVDVCIISGGRFEQYQEQVLDALGDSDDLVRLHLMPTCGTRYYRWRSHTWALAYTQDLTRDERSRTTAALTEGAKSLGLWETNTWGPIIEDRGSQVTYSALGQSAPIDAKTRWDPDGSKKEKLRVHVAALIPDLEVRSGGSTSVDVTRKGIDKAYGIKQLQRQLNVALEDLLFVGDRLDEGGNDYPVKALGVECIAVADWQATAHYVAELLDQLPTTNGETP